MYSLFYWKHFSFLSSSGCFSFFLLHCAVFLLHWNLFFFSSKKLILFLLPKTMLFSFFWKLRSSSGTRSFPSSGNWILPLLLESVLFYLLQNVFPSFSEFFSFFLKLSSSPSWNWVLFLLLETEFFSFFWKQFFSFFWKMCSLLFLSSVNTVFSFLRRLLHFLFFWKLASFYFSFKICFLFFWKLASFFSSGS